MVVQKRVCWYLSLLAIVVLAISLVWAASDDGTSSKQQRGPRRGGMFERGDFQERMKTMLKQELGASDEEWVVIEPRLTKVMKLSQETSIRPVRGMRGMGRPEVGPPMGEGMGPGGERGGQRSNQQQENAANAEQSGVQKAVNELRETLEKENPDTADIKAKLTSLREAREKARQELAKAQQELREILTINQEAKLVLAGLLD